MVTSSRTCTNHRDIYTKHQSPKIYEAKLTKSNVETDSPTITVGNFNTPLAMRHIRSRQKISKEKKIWTTP